MKYKYSSIIIIVLIIFTACKKYQFNATSLPTWHTAWLLPIAHGIFSFEDLKELSDNTVTYQIPAIDIGFPTGVLQNNIPGFTIANVGPYKQPLGNFITRVDFKKLQATIKMTNSFPIVIGAATNITFRQTNDITNPSNIIFSANIGTDVQPNDTFSFTVDIDNNFIEDTLYIFMDNFTSPGGTNVTFTNTPTLLSISLHVLEINSVDIATNKGTELSEVVPVSITDNNLNGKDTIANGKLVLYLYNQLPVNTHFQVYFANDDQSIIYDSLFGNGLNMTACNTDALGNPTNTINSTDSIIVNKTHIKNMIKSKKAIIKFGLNTNGLPPPKVRASYNTNFKFEIIGDLDIRFNMDNK